MSQSKNTLPPSPKWKMLARGVNGDEAITRCPAGHIHLDYGNFTVRFQPEEFLNFARLVTEAAARIQGEPWPASTRPFTMEPSLAFSLN
ncbi:MAG: hypothetical protein WA996_25080 [Candidatus Promineifilaceae bacterium]